MELILPKLHWPGIAAKEKSEYKCQKKDECFTYFDTFILDSRLVEPQDRLNLLWKFLKLSLSFLHYIRFLFDANIATVLLEFAQATFLSY